MTRHRQSPLVAQWGWPIGIALLTLFGLLSALIGEGGIWWWLCWGALATPLLVIVRHVGRSLRGKSYHFRALTLRGRKAR